MPTYEYECKKCSHNFEVFQAMSDAPVKKCPECGGEVRRLIFGGTGVIFKGSGFYVNDKSKAESKAKPAKTDKKTSGNADSKADSKAEGKPDSRADSRAEACAACPASEAGKCPAASTQSKSA